MVPLSSVFTNVAYKLTKKALFGFVAAVTHGLHAYLKAQVRIAWGIESFRFAVASGWSSSDEASVEWSGSFNDHLNQAYAQTKDGNGSFAWFMLFFFWGVATAYHVSCWITGELSYFFRYLRAPYAPWKKHPWQIARDQFMSLGLRESDLFALTIGRDDLSDIDVAPMESNEESSDTQCTDDSDDLSEEPFEETATTVQSATNEVETPNIPASIATDDEMDSKVQAPGIYENGLCMPFAEASSASVTVKATQNDGEDNEEITAATTAEQEKEHFKSLIDSAIKRFKTSRPIAMSTLQIAASKKTTKPKLVSSLQALAASTEKTHATVHGDNKQWDYQSDDDEPWRFSESVYESTYTTVLDLSKIPDDVIQRAEELANAMENNRTLEEPTESDEASDCQSQTRRLSGKSRRTRCVRSTR